MGKHRLYRTLFGCFSVALIWAFNLVLSEWRHKPTFTRRAQSTVTGEELNEILPSFHSLEDIQLSTSTEDFRDCPRVTAEEGESALHNQWEGLVDGVYAINLTHRKDRLERLQHHLSTVGLSKHTCVYHPPINYEEQDRVRHFASQKVHLLGHASSYESHRRVCVHALHTNRKRVLILEDDVRFVGGTGWIPNVKRALDQLGALGWVRYKLGYFSYSTFPSYLGLPLDTVQLTSTFVHAYIANVDTLCSELHLTPFEKRLPRNRVFLSDFHLSGALYQVMMVFYHTHRFIVRQYFRLVLKRNIRLPEIPQSYDEYLALRTSMGTFGIFPPVAYQSDFKADQTSPLDNRAFFSLFVRSRAIREQLALYTFNFLQILFPLLGFWFWVLVFWSGYYYSGRIFKRKPASCKM